MTRLTPTCVTRTVVRVLPFMFAALLSIGAEASQSAGSDTEQATTRPTSAMVPALSADALLQRVASTYADLRSYQDTGTATVSMTGPGPGSGPGGTQPAPVQHRFSTAFVAPDSFCFRFTSSADPWGHTNCGIVWLNGHDAKFFEPFRGVRQMNSFGMALASGTGVSDGIIGVVTPLLLHGRSAPMQSPLAFQNAVLLDDAAIDGVACHRVKGTWNQLEEHTLWIDAQTLLIRRLERSVAMGPFSTAAVIDFVPSANPDVPATALAFDPDAVKAALAAGATP